MLAYFGPFGRIWAVLSQNCAFFGVLLQALIMRWCTKTDKCEVCTWVSNMEQHKYFTPLFLTADPMLTCQCSTIGWFVGKVGWNHYFCSCHALRSLRWCSCLRGAVVQAFSHDGFEMAMVANINSPLASALPSSNSWKRKKLWVKQISRRGKW